ncbi:hypothetical protein I4U23_012102 [Adineta vaga]|nr:hypothetical protein I4U23_012102 [Adineta vaga]
MVAALHGHDDIIDLLFHYCDPKYQIELKGKVNISDEMQINGVTALYCACYTGHFTTTKILIEIGRADVNQSTDD